MFSFVNKPKSEELLNQADDDDDGGQNTED
jgi:hypothetical protein